MVSTPKGGVGWAARIVGLLTVVLGFWQWWGESQARQDPMLGGEVPGTWLDQWAVTTHLLPTLVLLVALVLAWRWPLVSAVAFGAFVIVAAIAIAPEWGYLLFALPHMVTAILFAADWWMSRAGMTKLAKKP